MFHYQFFRVFIFLAMAGLGSALGIIAGIILWCFIPISGQSILLPAAGFCLGLLLTPYIFGGNRDEN